MLANSPILAERASSERVTRGGLSRPGRRGSAVQAQFLRLSADEDFWLTDAGNICIVAATGKSQDMSFPQSSRRAALWKSRACCVGTWCVSVNKRRHPAATNALL